MSTLLLASVFGLSYLFVGIAAARVQYRNPRFDDELCILLLFFWPLFALVWLAKTAISWKN